MEWDRKERDTKKVALIFQAPDIAIEPYTASSMTIQNCYHITSTSTTEQLRTGNIKHASPQSQRRIIEELLEEIFIEKSGHFSATPSECSSVKIEESDYSIDTRLQYWKKTLNDRKMLRERIKSKVGKESGEMLINQRIMVDEPNKETVKRILDYAERMNPDNLFLKKATKLPAYVDLEKCRYINEIDETLPKAERDGYTNVEVSGLPNVSRKEILGSSNASFNVKYSWLDSVELNKKIEKKFEDIERVIEFFPDINRLQVVGKQLVRTDKRPCITLLKEESLRTISKSSKECDCYEECYCGFDSLEVEEESEKELIDLGISINGRTFIFDKERDTECLTLCYDFESDPFKRVLKTVLKIRNIGIQAISFSWHQGNYYYNNSTIMAAKNYEFILDTTSFRLLTDEEREFRVLYQPRKVAITTINWMLKMEPEILCCCAESLHMKLFGKCIPPFIYMDQISERCAISIDKSNKVSMKTLTVHHAELAPLIGPPEVYCPYEYTIDERDAFNNLNPGYNCERFDDLEVLKSLHKVLKKPREPAWDLKLETIKRLILRAEGADNREQFFADLTIILQHMAGRATSLEDKYLLNEAKTRARFIYVRGVICNGIEEWEEMVFTLEEKFFRPEMQRYYERIMLEEEEEEANEVTTLDPSTKETMFPNLDEEYATEAVMRKLKKSKFFRDSIYMHTYTLLCNIAEDIVSVIESTRLINP